MIKMGRMRWVNYVAHMREMSDNIQQKGHVGDLLKMGG